MEAICPENIKELEQEPLEVDFCLVQYVIDGKRQTIYIGEVMGSTDGDNNRNEQGILSKMNSLFQLKRSTNCNKTRLTTL
jgi:hypothetical protein